MDQQQHQREERSDDGLDGGGGETMPTPVIQCNFILAFLFVLENSKTNFDQ